MDQQLAVPQKSEKVVIKSNQFINGYFFNKEIKGITERVSAAELKLLAIVIAKVNPTSKTVGEVTVTLNEFNRMSKTKFHPSRFKEAVDLISMLRYNAMLPDTENRINIAGSFAVFRYAGLAFENGLLTAVFRIENDIYPYISELASNYTKLKLKDYFSLPSATHIRLFEILSQYKYRGKVRIKYTELRKMLGIEEGKYPDFNSFRLRVLNTAQQAILENTGLSFTYDIERSGRGGKTDAIIFNINTSERVQGNTEIQKKEALEKDASDYFYSLDEDDCDPDLAERERQEAEEEHRDNICFGFGDKVFDQFSDDELEYLRQAGWGLVPETMIQRHHILGQGMDKQFALSEYLKEKIMYARTKAPNNLFGYIKKVLEGEKNKMS